MGKEHYKKNIFNWDYYLYTYNKTVKKLCLYIEYIKKIIIEV